MEIVAHCVFFVTCVFLDSIDSKSVLVSSEHNPSMHASKQKTASWQSGTSLSITA